MQGVITCNYSIGTALIERGSPHAFVVGDNTDNGLGEQVLDVYKDVYKDAYNEAYPVVCMDESPKQLIKEIRIPIKMKPGSERKEDYEYERCGVANIFMANEPLTGKRFVKVTQQKKKQIGRNSLKK